jgi:ABC-type nitrate/sulfonate/bicarbonate transport system substrate-binding protein
MILSKNFVFVGLAFWVLSVYPLHAKDIVIATSSMTLTSVPYLVAIEKGFFEKEGLTAQYVVMRSDLAVKGLITGDVDYNQSVSSVLRAGVAGAPLITVAGIYNRTFFELIARHDIKSLTELKGKTVGISRYGASTEYALRFGLKANGIDPDKQKDQDAGSRRRCRQNSRTAKWYTGRHRVTGTGEFFRTQSRRPYAASFG